MEGEAPRLWLRYVDDTFLIANRTEKAALFEIINSILPGIKLTEEEENANQLPFLDVLVQRSQDGALKTTAYRKPTHTDQLLQANSNHPISAQVACIKPLSDRVETYCSTPQAKLEEIKTLRRICKVNVYSSGSYNVQ